MLAKNYVSHWDLDGLKPYMRYTMASGLNYETENLFITAESGAPSSKRDPKVILSEAEAALMNSPSHRAALLSKRPAKVSIGIAYNDVDLALVQQFEGDYITFSGAPVVKNGVLSLSGKALEGLTITQVQI